MTTTDAISNRAVGKFPLSIATSLAKEAIVGIHDDHPTDRPPLLDYDALYVNVKTLFRNLMGSLNKDDINIVVPPDIAEELAIEMDTIVSIVNDTTKGKSHVVFYYSDYADMSTRYPQAQIRTENTEKQKEYRAIQNMTMDLLLKRHQDNIQHYDLKLDVKGNPIKALILTHCAYDLLSYRKFEKLALAESHTGAIKQRAQWYTKYYQGSSLSMIPFREDFIQIFGDSEHFQPKPIRMRRAIVDVATKYGWSAVVTDLKISYGIDQIPDLEMRREIKTILMNNG